jgi:hypothetical protein
MAPSSAESQLESRARFIFQGTVIQTKAVTMPNVPVSSRTVVVRVDQVSKAPPALAQSVGREITVELAKGQKVKVGQRATFYTNGWVYGDGLAVRAVGLGPVRPAVAAAAASPGSAAEPARALADSDLRDRVARADLVVAGRVSGIRLPEPETQARALAAAAGAATPDHGPISEHDPLWREAVIEVEDVIKGSHGPRTLVVRFPSSTDVRWHKAPKFLPGQEGVWLLNKREISAPGGLAVAAGTAGAPGLEAYAAVGPLDYQPPQRLDHLKLLVKAQKQS